MYVPGAKAQTWTEAEVEELAVPATQTTAIIPGLSPSTTYHLRVLAQNGMGFSRPSEIIQVTTSEEAPEGPPLDVHIEPLTSSKLRVSWSPPEKHLWHGNILGYYLGYREIGGALMTPPTGLAAGGFLQDNAPFFTSSSSPTGSSSHEIHGYHFKTVEGNFYFSWGQTFDAGVTMYHEQTSVGNVSWDCGLYLVDYLLNFK
ncbi:unnamed protein product [Allacma fusca]|uniref:Fibronectin type-III domain-containing protein n=1 Tax=Allacma fusca TaxID=39272 RepID=A0A8J2NT17_9HEXA|nr:unnamed protein product [Allacma fusca]